MKEESVSLINECILFFNSENEKAVEGGVFELKTENFKNLYMFSDYGKRVNAFYSFLREDDGKKNRKPYGNYDVSLDLAVSCAK